MFLNGSRKRKIGAVWGNEYGHTIIPCNGFPRITHQTDGHSLEVVGKKETLIYSVPLVACYTEMNLISISSLLIPEGVVRLIGNVYNMYVVILFTYISLSIMHNPCFTRNNYWEKSYCKSTGAISII